VLISPGGHVYKHFDGERFVWPFTSLPLSVAGIARTAHLILDTAVAYSSAVVDLEDVLYGTDETDPRLPEPQEVLDIFEANAILQIIDHGDGSFTAIGPDSVVQMLDATSFEISWPSVVILDADTYEVSSL
jgi:hypothetical protein